MSSGGGFWPGEPPASEQEDVQEPLVAGTPGWRPPELEPKLEPEPESAPPAEVERKEPEPYASSSEEATREPATGREPEPEPQPPAMAEPPVMREPEPPAMPQPESEPEPEPPVMPEPEPEVAPPAAEPEAEAAAATAVHVPGELDVPDDVGLLEGSPSGADRTVGVVVSRFNGDLSNRLLASALDALQAAGVAEDRITVMPVPGAFELPIGAMALAKTRRYSCVVALGCVIRGETPHFEYVATEAASGLQLAGLETGVPVAFGVLTVDTAEQAGERTDRGAAAARAALEMADLFSQLRSQARG